MDTTRLEPRDVRSAARTAAGLLVAGGTSVVIAETAVLLGGSRDASPWAFLVSLGLVGFGALLGIGRRRMPALMWFVGALVTVPVVVGIDLLTHDAGGGAQVAFLLPVVYAGAFLRAPAAWIVAAAAIVADGVVAFTVLPLDQALTDYVFIVIAVVALTIVLAASGRRQDRLLAELHRVASTDVLTGLSTRRSLEASARLVLAQQRFDAEPRGKRDGGAAGTGTATPDACLGTGLLLVDLDRFKEVNDEHGHPVGDEVLVHVGGLLRGAVRRGDTVARFGGDELAVLLPGVGPEDARRLADVLRRKVVEAPLSVSEGEIRLTVSIGVAHAAPGASSLEQLYRAADAALYRAKREGRDRVVGESVAPVVS